MRYVFKTNFNLVQFFYRRLREVRLCSLLGSLLRSERPIWSVAKNRTTRKQKLYLCLLTHWSTLLVTWMPSIPIKSRMVDSRGRVKSAFQEALSSTFKVTDVSIKLIGPCDPNKESDSGEFDWGIWKHVLPPLLLIVIVGIPVSISCVVRKSRPKRRVAGQSKARHGRWGGDERRT